MTKLLKRVTRETIQLHGGRPIMVSMVPQGYFELVCEAAPSTIYRLGWEQAISAAKFLEAVHERAERARERRQRTR